MFHASWRKLSRLAFAAVAALGIAAQVQAVPTVFTGADPGEGLDLDGTFLYALNVGPNAGPGPIRDARFTTDAIFTSGATVSAQNNIAAGGWGAPNFGGGQDDARLRLVMSSIRWSANPADVVVTLPNLTIGETYKIQALFGEECCPRGFDVKVDGVTVEARVDLATLQGGSHTATNKGVVVTHEFVATANSVTLSLDQSNPGFGDNNPILNGLTLEHTSAAAPVIVNNVTIGRFTGADEGEGLDLKGAAPDSFTHAVNVGGGAVLVGDIQFTNGNPNSNAPNSVVAAHNHIPGWTTPNLGSSDADNALEQVVNSIRWTAENQDGGDIIVDIGDLTAGDDYKMQLMFTEQCCNGRGFDVFVDEQLTIDDFAPGIVQGGASGAPSAGSVITFEFTATDGHVRIRLNGLDNGAFTDGNPILSAFTVENVTIPEPASAMLGVMGLTALAFRRRRAA